MQPTDHSRRVNANDLEALIAGIFLASGLTEADAARAANLMVATNLYGIDSHGALRLGIYVQRLKAGQINPRPRLSAIACFGALEVMDGDNGLGYLVGTAAMEQAVRLAEAHGVGVVAAAHSNHFGAAALYARQAARQGMIGLSLSNVQPNMVVPGGRAPVVGNNPFAVAVPMESDFPFVLDIALSQVAAGKLLLAAKKGEKIPLDWAADRDGRPTDDPEKGFAGYLLPVGGYKGFGLALATDILCGVMAGSGFLNGVKGMYRDPAARSEVGHLMCALNHRAVVGDSVWRERIDAFVGMVKATPMRDPKGEMLLPGEIEHRSRIKRLAEGIPLPTALFDELNRLAREAGLGRQLKALPVL